MDYDRSAVVWNERFQTLVDALNETLFGAPSELALGSADPTSPLAASPLTSSSKFDGDTVRLDCHDVNRLEMT